jgi:hypothetical protein
LPSLQKQWQQRCRQLLQSLKRKCRRGESSAIDYSVLLAVAIKHVNKILREVLVGVFDLKAEWNLQQADVITPF